MSCAAEGTRAGGARTLAHGLQCIDDVVTRCDLLIEDHDALRRVGAILRSRQNIVDPCHIQGHAELADVHVSRNVDDE